jgi:hypothetical protein
MVREIMKTIGIIDENKEWFDNSAFGLFKFCPRKYFLRIEQSITLAVDSAALYTGTACHDSKATYLKAKMKGHSHEECRAVALHVLSKAMLAMPNPDDLRNETVIMRVMGRYFDRWRDEPYKTLETEIGFAVDMDDFTFVGKIDALKQLDAYGLLVEETKTTSIVGDRWPLRTKPNSQIDGYVSAYYINTGEMPYGAILDIIPIYDETRTKPQTQAARDLKVEKNKPFRLLTIRSEQDVENWIANTKEWYYQIQRSKENKVWPTNTDACAPLVGFTCEYIPICSEYPSVTNVHSMNISSIFKIEAWEPWEISKSKKEEIT